MAKQSKERNVVVYRFQRTFKSFLEPSLGEEKPHEPLVDMYEAENKLIVEVELPGVKKEDIEAYTIHNRLYLKAYRSSEISLSSESTRQYLCLERIFGEFYREIELPVACDTSKAKAKLENGVLIIEFPRVEERRGKRRDIKIE